MNMHGSQIIQAVILILEGDHPVEVKEQILCILANVADGDTAKDFIMSNEDVLKKLMNYMVGVSRNSYFASTTFEEFRCKSRRVPFSRFLVKNARALV